MKKIIIEHNLKLVPTIIASVLLLICFKLDLLQVENLVLYSGKVILVGVISVLSLMIAFGSSAKSIFQKPKNPIKIALIYLVIAFLTSMALGFVLQLVMHLNLKSNPGNKDVVKTMLSLPILLMFEEIISFFVLLLSSNVIFKITKNKLLSEIVGIMLSAVFFGLLHYSTYYSGDVVSTLIHIITLQGVTRIYLNIAGLRSDSIWTPWIIHLAFDFLTFGIGAFV